MRMSRQLRGLRNLIHRGYLPVYECIAARVSEYAHGRPYTLYDSVSSARVSEYAHGRPYTLYDSVSSIEEISGQLTTADWECTTIIRGIFGLQL